MIKRTNNLGVGGLPTISNDSTFPTNAPKTSNQNRRRPNRKNSTLLRFIGAAMLILVASLYVIGTRYVFLASPSLSSGRSVKKVVHASDVFYDRDGKALRNLQHNDLPASHKPRTIGHYYALADSKSFIGTERLDHLLNIQIDNSKTRIFRGDFMTKEEVERQQHLLDSDDYEDNAADTMEDQGEDCVVQYDWQETVIPTCNHIMEVDMTNLNLLPMFNENHYNNKHDTPTAASSLHSYSKLISNGHWRDVWRIENLLRHKGKQEETFILKTMRYGHDYYERNYDRHRRDALTMEELTASVFVMNIYGACGNSGLFEYADGGSLDDSIWYNYHKIDTEKEKPWSPKEKLVIAHQAISGVADLHNFAKEGVPAVAHTDISPDQFVYVDEAGLYKLNDFNRARFIGKHNNTNELCTYRVGGNPGFVSSIRILFAARLFEIVLIANIAKFPCLLLNQSTDYTCYCHTKLCQFRSPEEYEYTDQTEKVDIFQLGNVLYSLLTGKYPFEDIEDSKTVERKVKAGKRPHIPTSYRNSTDPFDQALLKVIEMSWIHEPKERASAREMQTFISSELKRLNDNK